MENTRGWTYNPVTGEFTDNKTGEVLDFKFFPKEKEFHTSSGVVLKYKPLNSQYLFDYQDRLRDDQPKIPQRPVEYGEGQYYMDSYPEDAAYQQELALWRSRFGVKVLKYTFRLSIINNPPPIKEWDTHMRKSIDLIGGMSEVSEIDIYYQWIMSLVNSEHEMAALTLITQGQSLPTNDGIEQASRRFPSDAE